MRREGWDSRFFTELHDLNLAFLELVGTGRRCSHGPVFGLDTAIVDQLSRFGPAELAQIAATPCLLVQFAPVRSAGLQQHAAEPAPAGDPEWTGQARLFAASLLTYLWQTPRHDGLHAALRSGPAAAAVTDALRFADIRSLATRALQQVEARFLQHVRFWPDLVKAARDGQPDRLQLARLAAIQLATSESTRPAPSRTPFAPRLTGVRLAGR